MQRPQFRRLLDVGGDHHIDGPEAHRLHLLDDVESAFRALASDRRLLILEWLKRPKAHFRPQVDGDLVKDGVCGALIAEKLGVSQPTVSKHLSVLRAAGLVTVRKDAQRRLYSLNPGPLKELDQWLARYRRFWSGRLDALEAHLDREFPQ